MNRFSELTADQQNTVLKALVNSLYSRVRVLQINIEFEKGIRDSYGTTQMDNHDRLINRLMADLILTDNGIPEHDTQAQRWLDGLLFFKEVANTEPD